MQAEARQLKATDHGDRPQKGWCDEKDGTSRSTRLWSAAPCCIKLTCRLEALDFAYTNWRNHQFTRWRSIAEIAQKKGNQASQAFCDRVTGASLSKSPLVLETWSAQHYFRCHCTLRRTGQKQKPIQKKGKGPKGGGNICKGEAGRNNDSTQKTRARELLWLGDICSGLGVYSYRDMPHRQKIVFNIGIDRASHKAGWTLFVSSSL